MRPLRSGINSLEDGGFPVLFHRRFGGQLAYPERKNRCHPAFKFIQIRLKKNVAILAVCGDIEGAERVPQNLVDTIGQVAQHPRFVDIERFRVEFSQLPHGVRKTPDRYGSAIDQRPAMHQVRERNHVPVLAPCIEQAQADSVDMLHRIFTLGQIRNHGG